MLNDLKNEIIKYGDIVDAKGFSPGASGNISVRYKDKIIITASGSSNGDLAWEDLVVIDFEGKVIEGDKKASSEKMLHVAFYKKRSDINAIIHVHPSYLSSFAAAGKGLEEPVMAENVYYFGKIPLAPYALPSSKELVEKTEKYFEKHNAVLMANHGFIVGDINLKQAYLKLELAESYAQVVLNAKLLGGAVLLNKKEVEEIEALKI
ncbi:MAG TPA: class II aldolase/adducin family protein [Candidatus Gastranaerophilaceae bacterium]|mgnify:CR=1 FL=1|nr:class II aldolase/adducin family protein [Candidatus Gastranaerophilaceae bacterium]HPT41620.1 class II aldolase/adducin family protein [Candidatus Gastranaerophilaceae bacterium]